MPPFVKEKSTMTNPYLIGALVWIALLAIDTVMRHVDEFSFFSQRS
jgi:hypothetical protein